MHPDTPIAEADPADALEQRRPVLPEDEDTPVVPAAGREADPADLADQLRDAGQDHDAY